MHGNTQHSRGIRSSGIGTIIVFIICEKNKARVFVLPASDKKVRVWERSNKYEDSGRRRKNHTSWSRDFLRWPGRRPNEYLRWILDLKNQVGNVTMGKHYPVLLPWFFDGNHGWKRERWIWKRKVMMTVFKSQTSKHSVTSKTSQNNEPIQAMYETPRNGCENEPLPFVPRVWRQCKVGD